MRRSVKYWQKRLISQRIRSANQTLAKISRNARQNSNQGFALPMALGMGLIMLLVGVTMILRSQDDQVTASAQKATGRALSAAETGITRYQALINNNRAIATYPNSGTPSWSNPSTISGIENPCTTASETTTVRNIAVNNEWQYIDSTNAETKKNKGQYRLISYVYPAPGTGGTVGVAPGTGQLTVEGRVGQIDNDNNDSSASSGVSTGTTRLQVKIPVNAGNAPALWIQNVTQNMGNNKVAGNILVSGCTVPSGVSLNNVTSGNTVIASPGATMPATPALPTSNLNSISASSMNSRIWRQTLPKVGDTNANGLTYTSGTTLSATDPPYHYLIQGNLAKNGGADITLRSGAKIIFYVQGNISLGGNPVINKNGYPQNMQIYGNTYTSATTTKYGCAPGLTLNSNCPTLSLSANGSGSIRALIHAPDATGRIAGSGGGCNTSVDPPAGGGFIGSVWIKKWDRQSNNAGPMVCAYGNYGSYNLVRSPLSIAPITAWQRKEVAP